MKAIIFDFDGLIIDTETAIFKAWEKTYHDFGCELDPLAYSGCVGSGHQLFDPQGDLEKQSGQKPDWKVLRPAIAAHYRSLIGQMDALPGIRDCVRRAGELGMELAIASSSHRVWVEEHLSRLGLLGAFSVIRTRDDVSHVKPEPDLFLAAMKVLRMGPDDAFVLEDSPHGARAAFRADLFCVAVPNEITRPLEFPDSAWVIESLAQTPLDHLLEGIRERKACRA